MTPEHKEPRGWWINPSGQSVEGSCVDQDLYVIEFSDYEKLEAKLALAVEALEKADQYMVSTNLERARLRGDYKAVVETLAKLKGREG